MTNTAEATPPKFSVEKVRSYLSSPSDLMGEIVDWSGKPARTLAIYAGATLFVLSSLVFPRGLLSGGAMMSLVANFAIFWMVVGGVLANSVFGKKSSVADSEDDISDSSKAEREEEVYEIVPPEVISKVVEWTYQRVNVAASCLRRLVLWKSPLRSMRFMLALYVAGKVLGSLGSWLTPTFIALVCVQAFFLAPLALPVYRKVVDENVKPALSRMVSSIPRFTPAKMKSA